MDKQYVEQFDVSRRYLNGTLSPEQRIKFEEYILDKPAMIEQLELDSMIMAGLKTLPGESKVAAFWRPVHSHVLATAASVALVAVLLVDFAGAPAELNRGTGSVSPEIVYLETFRSQDISTAVVFNEGAMSTYMVAAVPSTQDETLKVTLYGESGFSLLLAESKANSEGDLVIALDKNNVKPGMYRVVVDNESNETIKQYSIEVVH